MPVRETLDAVLTRQGLTARDLAADVPDDEPDTANLNGPDQND